MFTVTKKGARGGAMAIEVTRCPEISRRLSFCLYQSFERKKPDDPKRVKVVWEGGRMPGAGSRVVRGGATFVVQSRTGDTLECHALGSPLSTICEWPLVSPNTDGCMVCVSMRLSPCVADDCLRCCFSRSPRRERRHRRRIPQCARPATGRHAPPKTRLAVFEFCG